LLHKMRLRLYSDLLSLNPLHREANVSGELIARFTIDVEQLEKSISQGLMALFRDILQIIALAFVALALDPWMGMVGLFVFPPIALVIVRLGRRVRKRRAEVHRAFGTLSTTVEESAAGLQVIRAFGAEPMMMERFRSKSREIYRSAVRAIVIKAESSPLNEIMAASALALTLWFSHRRIEAGQITPEGFISFFSALLLLYQPIKGIGTAQHVIQSGLAALERLPRLSGKWISSPQEVFSRRMEKSTEGRDGVAVELRAVEAAYIKGQPVLKQVNLTLPRGGRIAVVGRSGAGKTSLLQILQGFLPVTGGEVRIDERPVSLNPETAGGIFSPVSQEPFLFDDTIRMNVLCGNPLADEKAVQKVCELAGVGDFARHLPDELDFIVGPAGKSLSFGQRQRICLARALLCEAPILLLDEVTASLDGQTEEEIIGRLEGDLQDRTIVLVTHRLATAKWANEVVFIDDATVRFQGRVDDLLKDQPELWQIFGTQVA
jgi:ATP-binding cassette, subfamily B, bacterial MsbA